MHGLLEEHRQEQNDTSDDVPDPDEPVVFNLELIRGGKDDPEDKLINNGPTVSYRIQSVCVSERSEDFLILISDYSSHISNSLLHYRAGDYCSCDLMRPEYSWSRCLSLGIYVFFYTPGCRIN